MSDFDAPVELTAEGPRLLGGRCSSCAAVSFPRRPACNVCATGTTERWLLPATGSLWTFTVQGFAPKSPPYVPADEFEAFGVGYVEFAEELRVEGRLTVADPAALRIGAPMRVELLDVADRALYAFAPAEDER